MTYSFGWSLDSGLLPVWEWDLWDDGKLEKTPCEDVAGGCAAAGILVFVQTQAYSTFFGERYFELRRLCLISLELGPLLPQEIISLSKPWAFAPNFSEGSWQNMYSASRKCVWRAPGTKMLHFNYSIWSSLWFLLRCLLAVLLRNQKQCRVFYDACLLILVFRRLSLCLCACTSYYFGV